MVYSFIPPAKKSPNIKNMVQKNISAGCRCAANTHKVSFASLSPLVRLKKLLMLAGTLAMIGWFEKEICRSFFIVKALRDV